jgi:FMN phosphatase YigB (HAD superfamily)
MSRLHCLGQVKAILFDLDGTLIEADGAAMEVVLARFPGGRSLGTLGCPFVVGDAFGMNKTVG